MSFFDVLRVALLDLALHKFRSFLAALGIIVGVGSVIAVFSISDGQKRKALARFDSLGVRNIHLLSVRPSEVGIKRSEQQQRQQQAVAYGLLRRDLRHVQDHVGLTRYVIGVRDMRAKLFSSTGRLLDLHVLATEPDYLRVTRSHVIEGRFLAEMDGRNFNQVCVVGVEAARQLFGAQPPLNRYVRVGATWYKVVGIIENPAGLKTIGGEDVNNQVFIPLQTAEVRHGRISYDQREAVKVELDSIIVNVAEQEDVPGVSERLQRYLDKSHKELTNQVDYAVNVPLDKMRQKAREQQDYTQLVVSIAAISMLVGGIGIMNIMLANVADRRKEIGTRRALGARRRDILRQFIIEAATLTTLGGLVGLLLGYGIAQVFGAWVQTPIAIDLGYVARALIASCLVGIFFGFWPAWQAAKVNPIEALRSE